MMQFVSEIQASFPFFSALHLYDDCCILILVPNYVKLQFPSGLRFNFTVIQRRTAPFGNQYPEWASEHQTQSFVKN